MKRPRIFRSTALTLALSPLAGVPMSAAVFIVRHGEKQTEANDKEVPLSEAGRARARRIAEMFRDAGVVAVYSTDTVRTPVDRGSPPPSRRYNLLPRDAAGRNRTDLKPLAKKILEDQAPATSSSWATATRSRRW